jgi:hypothetical protein
MAVAYYDWIFQVFDQVDQVASSYIITSVGAPRKGIAKVGMWVTDNRVRSILFENVLR